MEGTPDAEKLHDMPERTRRLIERLKADKTVMDGIRESLERRARGEYGITLEELQKLIREREAPDALASDADD